MSSDQAEHFVGVLRRKEHDAGKALCARALLQGNVEMDGTSLGRFYVRKDTQNPEFSEQIKTLRKTCLAQGKEVPKAYEVHVMVLGASERGGCPIVWGPDCRATCSLFSRLNNFLL